MKFSFMQNPLTQIQFYAWIYNSFINSHLLEWLKVRQIKSGIRVNFDQCEVLSINKVIACKSDPAMLPKSWFSVDNITEKLPKLSAWVGAFF